MGAWGLKLFQSDYDYDLIQMLNHLTDLDKLEQKAGKTPWPSGIHQTRVKEHDTASRLHIERAGLTEEDLKAHPGKEVSLGSGTGDDIDFVLYGGREYNHENPEINYSMYMGLCTDPDVVRKHLDSGALKRAFNGVTGTMSKSTPAQNADPDGPGYDLMLLGACAMSLGAKLEAAMLWGLRFYHDKVGLPRDALTQMKAALDGYKNGTPWIFDSLCTRHAPMPPKEDMLFPGTGMTNTRAPIPPKPEELEMARAMFREAIEHREVSAKDLAVGFANLKLSPADEEKKVKQFDGKVCAGCGEGNSDGGRSLRLCAGCGKSMYCGKACQKAHWVMGHKKDCKKQKA